MADYIYGIVEASAEPPDGQGVAGAPVRLVKDDRAAALVSDIAEREIVLGREEVMTHARVLEQALQHGTVLPMRFGVVMEGDEDVSDRLLASHAGELGQQLARFKETVEINIRATYDENALMREVLSENPDIAQRRESLQGKPEDATYYERIELGERVSNAVERKRDDDAEKIVAALSQVAEEVAVAPSPHERVALSAAFLVRRNRISEFDQVLDAFAAGQGGRLRFKYTGPLPPHSFVELAGAG